MKRCAGGRNRPGIVLLIITLLCFAYCGTAVAEYTSTPMDITVEGGGYTGTLTLDPEWFAPGYWDQVFSSDAPVSWNSKDIFPAGIDIAAENDDGIILAHINGLTVAYEGDPVATLGFSVTAGAYATSFSFSSPLMTFDAITNAEAYAEAAVSITGSQPPIHTLYGSYPGPHAYKALYNNGTVFSYLLDTPITSISADDTGAMAPLPGTITSMQSKFQFILTAGDTANGSSYYEIGTVIPEPATMALLGLGGFALLRKRN